MSDITTVEEVQAEDYTVRVAQTDDGSAWEAVVLSEDDSGSDRPMGGMAGMMILGHPSQGSDDSDEKDTPIGPPVTAPHRWVAVGFAIEAYEWPDESEHPVDVADGYESVRVDSVDLSFSEGMELIDTTTTPEVDLGDFPGPWEPEGDG